MRRYAERVNPTPARRPDRIGGLDALRGLAALAVFVCHIAAYWGELELPERFVKFTQIGAHGVDVFVVLSGFVLMIPFTKPGRTVNVAQFYGRRMWRILPAYWVALAIAAILATGPLAPLVVGPRASAWDVIVHAFGLQTVFVPTLSSINGSLWSVSLEITLYLVFPLLLVAIYRFGGMVVTLLAAALCVTLSLTGASFGGLLDGFPSDPHTLPMRLVQFVIGMALATVLARADLGRLRESRRHRTIAWVSAAVVGLLAVLATTFEAPSGVDLSMWGLSGATLVWVFVLFRPGRFLGALEKLGQRAYSFYLIHQPIVLLSGAVAVLLPGPGLVVLAYAGLVCLLLTCVAAEILYRFVERPSHQAAQRRYPTIYRTVGDTTAEKR